MDLPLSASLPLCGGSNRGDLGETPGFSVESIFSVAYALEKTTRNFLRLLEK
jgi:hypothetical protein